MIDECHRGSAADDSNWREILDYFEPAYQLGHDGHAATARTTRTHTSTSVLRSTRTACAKASKTDSLRRTGSIESSPPWMRRDGVPKRDRLMSTATRSRISFTPRRTFERDVVLRQRTDAIAKHITNFLKDDPYAKTIVFCVDQEHAENMRAALSQMPTLTS